MTKRTEIAVSILHGAIARGGLFNGHESNRRLVSEAFHLADLVLAEEAKTFQQRFRDQITTCQEESPKIFKCSHPDCLNDAHPSGRGRCTTHAFRPTPTQAEYYRDEGRAEFYWIPTVSTGAFALQCAYAPQHHGRPVTRNIHNALKFPTEAECRQWCEIANRHSLAPYTPTKHGFHVKGQSPAKTVDTPKPQA